MGRHAAPGTGKPTPDQGFWVRLGAVVLALAIGGSWFLTRGGDDPVTTASKDGPTTSASPADRETASTTPSPSPAASTSSPAPATTGPTKDDPPTLAFRVLRPSYITVRVPGGPTLVSKEFRRGARRSFDRKVLQVVNGRPSAVRFTVNGKPRKPGPADEPETFTVRRR